MLCRFECRTRVATLDLDDRKPHVIEGRIRLQLDPSADSLLGAIEAVEPPRSEGALENC